MVALRAGQRAVTQRRQRRAVAGFLDAGPRQTGIEIVAAVHIDRAGLDRLADALGGMDVLGPDGRSEAIGAVVHQSDRLFRVADFDDADDGAETLFAHNRHRMIDIGENLRREVGRARPIPHKGPRIDMGFRALVRGLVCLRAHDFGEASAGHRTERRSLIERIAEDILAGQLDESLHERVVARFVDVDALDATAALPGIEEGAVDQTFDCEFQIGVCRDIGRILAAEFEAECRERSGRRALHRAPRLDRSGECDMIDMAARDDGFGLAVLQHDVGEQALGQTDGVERLLEAVADQQCLRGLLEQHRIARDQRRHDRVHGRQIRVVPGRDGEDDAHRLAHDIAFKSRARIDRNDGRQRGLRDLGHIARALLDAAKLALTVADGTAHLPGQFLRDLLAHALSASTKRTTSDARSLKGTRRHAFWAARARSSVALISASVAVGRST